MAKRVAVTTGNNLEGYEVSEYLGVVRGIVVRAQTIGQGIRGAFSSILGGNIKAYEEVCEQARSEAFARMVGHAEEKGADAVLAMYHDQGLPVLKYASFGRGVNVTLGLPFVRTSVDHGTALDLAGTGRADTTSLAEALKLAVDLASAA